MLAGFFVDLPCPPTYVLPRVSYISHVSISRFLCGACPDPAHTKPPPPPHTTGTAVMGTAEPLNALTYVLPLPDGLLLPEGAEVGGQMGIWICLSDLRGPFQKFPIDFGRPGELFECPHLTDSPHC